MTTPRIVFMGTPPFAVATLNALVEAGIEVAAVVTAPDRPAGRGRQLRTSAVKDRAVELGLPILQPERLRDPQFITSLETIGATQFVVVAFRMLPAVVWGMPPKGTVNLHASLLPDYRGAAPINWAIINGERTTGVTTFLIAQEIDTGDILLQRTVDIGPDTTAGELHDALMTIGADLMVTTVEGVHADTLVPRVQPMVNAATLHAAPKITPAHVLIDPSGPTTRVHDLVRGMSPHPGAWCMLQWNDRPAIPFKVLRTAHTTMMDPSAAGSVVLRDGHLFMACADGWLELLEVQQEGRKRMSAAEFSRGLQHVERLVATRGEVV